MTTTFHFNRRDPSFRHNLSSIGQREGTLVTGDHRAISFKWLLVSGDTVTVGNEEDQHVVSWGSIELVDVEVD